MAQTLGLDFVRGYVLGNLGVMRALEGDRGGLEQLEQSIEILGALNAPDVVRSYNNLMYTLFRLGELDRVEELAQLMDEAAERWGSPEWLRWAWSQRLELAFERGRWDEATDTLDRLVGSLLEGRQHYLEAVWRTFRSRMHAARGEDARAEEDASVAVAMAREGSDPQVIVPALAWCAVQLQTIGAQDVRSLATELLRILHAMPPSVASSWLADVAIVLSGLGWHDEFGELARHFRVPTPWRDGSVALAAGDYAGAAEVFAAMGASTQEAEARLRGARAGVDADLAKAIAFFRQVGASARLAEAESLLATSRSA